MKKAKAIRKLRDRVHQLEYDIEHLTLEALVARSVKDKLRLERAKSTKQQFEGAIEARTHPFKDQGKVFCDGPRSAGHYWDALAYSFPWSGFAAAGVCAPDKKDLRIAELEAEVERMKGLVHTEPAKEGDNVVTHHGARAGVADGDTLMPTIRLRAAQISQAEGGVRVGDNYFFAGEWRRVVEDKED